MDLCLQTNQHEIQIFDNIIFYVGCMLFLDLFAWHQPQSIKSAMIQSLKLLNIVLLLA